MEEGIRERSVIRLRHRTNTVHELQTLDARFGGIEIDVVGCRRGRGEDQRVVDIIVSHCPEEWGLLLRDFAPFFKSHQVIAINIKEYGLLPMLNEILQPYAEEGLQMFFFDVPGPELKDYIAKSEIDVFGRQSEFETQLGCDGLLIDSLEGTQSWLDNELVNSRLNPHPTACISNSLRGVPDAFMGDLLPDFLITKEPE